MQSQTKFEDVLDKDGELVFTNVGYSMYPLIKQREDILTIVKTDNYKKGDVIYQLSVLPFLAAVFVNVLLPNRETFQVALLTVLFALTFAFLLRQKDEKFTSIIGILMVAISLVFSIYSSIKANTQFLGEISQNWPTYVAMYLSIFVPVIMSGTFALTYNVRCSRED